MLWYRVAVTSSTASRPVSRGCNHDEGVGNYDHPRDGRSGIRPVAGSDDPGPARLQYGRPMNEPRSTASRRPADRAEACQWKHGARNLGAIGT